VGDGGGELGAAVVAAGFDLGETLQDGGTGRGRVFLDALALGGHTQAFDALFAGTDPVVGDVAHWFTL
jgi:hypothetical protein